MFPQVAPKFFSTRDEGPKNVSKAAAEPAPAKPAEGQAKADGKGQGPVTGPITYEVKIGDKSHKVSVQPA
jgi:methylmalonyl-CoA carboxyltransferase 5S subunit